MKTTIITSIRFLARVPTILILPKPNSNHNVAINTLAGTILSVSYIAVNDIVKAAVLAAVGAVVSLLVSLLLRYILKKVRQKFGG